MVIFTQDLPEGVTSKSATKRTAPDNASQVVFSSAQYRSDPGTVIAHARKTGTAVVADSGETKMVIRIPTRDLK